MCRRCDSGLYSARSKLSTVDVEDQTAGDRLLSGRETIERLNFRFCFYFNPRNLSGFITTLLKTKHKTQLSMAANLLQITSDPSSFKIERWIRSKLGGSDLLAGTRSLEKEENPGRDLCCRRSLVNRVVFGSMKFTAMKVSVLSKCKFEQGTGTFS